MQDLLCLKVHGQLYAIVESNQLIEKHTILCSKIYNQDTVNAYLEAVEWFVPFFTVHWEVSLCSFHVYGCFLLYHTGVPSVEFLQSCV